jgi:hypothetical protein
VVKSFVCAVIKRVGSWPRDARAPARPPEAGTGGSGVFGRQRYRRDVIQR